MSPRKAARFSLGTLIWFRTDHFNDEMRSVGTIIGTWEWSGSGASTRIESYGTDPRFDNESNGYLILSSDPKVDTKYAFYADVTLGYVGTL